MTARRSLPDARSVLREAPRPGSFSPIADLSQAEWITIRSLRSVPVVKPDAKLFSQKEKEVLEKLDEFVGTKLQNMDADDDR